MTTEKIDIKDETLLSRNPNIIASQIDGETVMMDEDFDNYFGMAKVGTYIWSQLEQEISFGDLIKRLADAAGDSVTVEKCREDTLAFLNDLNENGFLKIGGQE